MRPVPMRVKHNPPHTYGDCHRACMESILEVEVPHFLSDDPPYDEWQRRIRG